MVKEEKGNRGGCDVLRMRITGDFVISPEDGDDQITETLAGGSVYHETTACPPFDVGNGNSAEEQMRNGVVSGRSTSETVV